MYPKVDSFQECIHHHQRIRDELPAFDILLVSPDESFILIVEDRFLIPGVEVKLEDVNSEGVGEIWVKGPNVMLGYYKDEAATRQAIDEEGYYHTGDLGTLSASNHLFIRGRIKNMLLGANGQNVYPEEIEDKLNSMPMVSESIVVQRDDKLVAIVHPDRDEMVSFTEQELEHIMEQNCRDLNAMLPAYSHISAIELRSEEFAKTPKKSIKRYLYN